MHETRNSESSASRPVFGIRPVIEAIEAGREIDKVFIQRGLQGDLARQLMGLLKDRNIPFQTVPIEKLNRLTRKNHQGVYAFSSEVEYESLFSLLPAIFESGRDPLIVVLDRITDVRNFGAIVRSAECLGAHAVVLPSRGGAPANADALKTSAGALQRIPICREENLKKTLSDLKQSGLRLVACTEKAASTLYETALTGPMVLLLGSEEDGISEAYLDLCDQRCSIPMRGHTASLNVSVSAGIFLAEVDRQRRMSEAD